MDRTYTCRKKYVLADGTVKYCEYQKKYTAKEKKPREKKPGSIYGIDCMLKNMKRSDRILVEAYTKGLLEKAETPMIDGENESVDEHIDEKVNEVKI